MAFSSPSMVFNQFQKNVSKASKRAPNAIELA